MTRHQLLPGQRLQGVQVLQPHLQPRAVGRGQCALVEHQVAGEQHTGAFIQNRQVGTGVPAQRQQPQAVPTHLVNTWLQHAGRQHHLGTAHPVANQAVHVLGHGLPLLAQQLAGTGQGADGHIGKGLVAQHMVGVMMGQQHFDYRLVGGGGNGLAQGFAVAFRRPAVDHHHPAVGDDERGVDDIAAVILGEIVGAALQQPGAFGDLPGLEPIVQVCPGRQAQAQ